MMFDYNKDGRIDVEELRRIVTSMGEKLTLDEANMMISVADIDKDGKIDYKGKPCVSVIMDGHIKNYEEL